MKLLLALLFFSAAANASTEVNNDGAGVSEQNLVYAYLHMNSLLKDCLEKQACDLDSAEIALVRELATPIVSEAVDLAFANRDAMGDDLFRRSAFTWTVNAEKLWLDAESSVPYKLSDAVNLLLEISAEAAGRNFSSITRGKVATHFLQSSAEVKLSLGDSRKMHFLFWRERSRLVVFMDLGQPLDLTDAIVARLPVCEQSVRVLDPISLEVEGDLAHYWIRARTCGAEWAEFQLTLKFANVPIEGRSVWLHRLTEM